MSCASPVLTSSTLSQARDLQPNDLAILFNIAIIQQKGVEILFDLPPHRRTLAEIHVALADAEASQA
jgi:RNA polymerase-associated protein CTR9